MDRLPQETVDEIASYLDTDDLVAVYSLNRTFAAAARCVFWSKLTFLPDVLKRSESQYNRLAGKRKYLALIDNQHLLQHLRRVKVHW